MDEQTMLDEIATKVRDLDWCEGVDFDDYEPILYVKTNDGREIGIKIKENPNPGEKLAFNESENNLDNTVSHAEKALSLLNSLPRIQNGRIGPTEFEYVVNSENYDERLSITLSRVRMALEDIVYGKN